MTKAAKRRHRLEEQRKHYEEQAKSEARSFFLDDDPTKQYVRRFGWLNIAQEYAKRRQEDGIDRPLSYLSFPGPNATDIGLLWREGLLVRDDDGFPYVAICDDTNADKALAILGRVKAVSSKAFHVAVRKDLAPYFPFDIVNLDLYGSVVTGNIRRHRATRTLDGIRDVFNLQRGQSFLLLLTCSTDDRSARRYLEGVLVENLEEDEFRSAYCERYGSSDLSPFKDDYRGFVSLVLPKAIGRMARDRGYKVTERFVAKYDRDKNKMLALSFELEQLGHKNPAKKYEPCFRDSNWDELSQEPSNRTRTLATQAYAEFVPCVVRRDLLDVTQALNSDRALAEEMTREAHSLIAWWESNV